MSELRQVVSKSYSGVGGSDAFRADRLCNERAHTRFRKLKANLASQSRVAIANFGGEESV